MCVCVCACKRERESGCVYVCVHVSIKVCTLVGVTIVESNEIDYFFLSYVANMEKLLP